MEPMPDKAERSDSDIRLQSKSRELWKLIRRRPAVVVLPLVLFIVVSAVGLVVVFLVAQREQNRLRETTTARAIDAANDMEGQLLSMVQPVSSMAAFLSSGFGRNLTWVQQAFPQVAEKLLSEVTSTANSAQLKLAPQGVITDVYPVNDINKLALGVDLLGDPSKQNGTLAVMCNPNKVYFRGPSVFGGGYMGISAAMAVYVSGVKEDFNFSMPVPVSPYCPPKRCWQEATKTKFWGVVAGSWPLDVVLNGDGSGGRPRLANLQDAGYRYVLKQLAVNASLPATPGYGDYVMIARSDADVDDPVEVPVDLNGALSSQAAPWVLSVSPDAGWSSAWVTPVVVVIVVVSFIGAVLLSAFLISRVSRAEDEHLLFSLVPKDAFRKLKERQYSACDLAPTASVIPAGNTPADALLELLADCLMGKLPKPAMVVQLRAVLLSLQDIYRPADVSQELRDAHLDEDVANNLAQLLSNESRTRHRDAVAPNGSGQPLRCLATTSMRQAEEHELEESWVDLEDLGSLNAPLVAEPPHAGPPQLAGQCGPAVLEDCQPQQQQLESCASVPNMFPEALNRIASATRSYGPAPISPSQRSFSKSPGLLMLELSTSPQGGRGTAERGLFATSSFRASRMAMPRAVHDKLQCVLGQAYSSWTFNAFELDAASDGHPLSTLGFYLLEKTGLMQHFKLPPTKVARFFQSLEAAYIDNPYHSRTHAADVLQTLHVILTQGGFLHSYVDPVRHLACILAAASHDVEHVGLTNDFLCTTEDVLALRYNDRSPMENHHLASLFTLIKRPNHDFMRHLDRSVRDLVRKTAIEMVMATDMKQHMTMCSHFRSVHQANRRTTGLPTLHSAPVFIDETERLLSLQMAMKLADLGHLAETPEVHQKWVAALENEFFLQGDKEREAGIPITPLFDRMKPGITKSQVGFYDFVVMPLFTSFSGAFKNVQPLVDCAAENYRFWKENAEVKT